jgi:hypothetical protein
MSIDQLPKFAQRAFERLRPGMLLIRTSSDSDEAVEKGGGFLYSIEPGGRKFPTASGKLLIEEGLLAPNGDGLLLEVSQTYRRDAS